MRNKFNEQLVELNNEMISMGIMIEKSISKTVEALNNGNIELAGKIMEGDEQVDRAQKKIENICFNLIVEQQPVAKDLRTITAALKMVTDMERIGDHAADISEITAKGSISVPVAERVSTSNIGSAALTFEPSSTRSHASPSYFAPAATWQLKQL